MGALGGAARALRLNGFPRGGCLAQLHHSLYCELILQEGCSIKTKMGAGEAQRRGSAQSKGVRVARHSFQ